MAEIRNEAKTFFLQNNELLIKVNELQFSSLMLNAMNLQLFLKSQFNYVSNHLGKLPFFGVSIKLEDSFINRVPYLLTDYIVNSCSDLVGTSGFISIDLSLSNAPAIKRCYNHNILKELMDKVCEVVSTQSLQLNHDLSRSETDSEAPKQTQRPFGITLIHQPSILTRLDLTIVSEDECFNLLTEIANQPQIKAVILEGGILTPENYILRHSSKNKEKLLKQLELVRNFKSKKGPVSFSIITNDGVKTGQDIKDFYDNGADFVLINSPLLVEGPSCISRLLKEYRMLI